MVVDGDADGDGGGAAAAAVLTRNIWDNRTNIKEVYFSCPCHFSEKLFQNSHLFNTYSFYFHLKKIWGESIGLKYQNAYKK